MDRTSLFRIIDEEDRLTVLTGSDTPGFTIKSAGTQTQKI